MSGSGAGARVALGGLMAGLAALLQAGPVYWPGPGYLLAALSSLPVAVQALRAPRNAPLGALAAAGLLLAVQAQEAAVFSLTTAPLGLAVGWCRRARLPGWRAALLSALPLWAGMWVLARVVGLAPLGPWLADPGAGARALAAQAGGFGLFALAYSSLWVWGFGAFARRLGMPGRA